MNVQLGRNGFLQPRIAENFVMVEVEVAYCHLEDMKKMKRWVLNLSFEEEVRSDWK